MPQLEEIEQRTQEWLDARRGRITASLAAACLGIDPYTSRQKAFRSIMGTEPDRDNRHMAWGREFEQQARNEYECETGNFVDAGGFWVSDDFDWLAASPDGLVGSDGLIEIKVPGSLPDAVPINHRIQMIVQMIVTGRAWCDYFSWTHEGSFLRRVHLAGAQGIIRRLDEFRTAFVLTNTEPPRKKRKRRTGSSIAVEDAL